MCGSNLSDSFGQEFRRNCSPTQTKDGIVVIERGLRARTVSCVYPGGTRVVGAHARQKHGTEDTAFLFYECVRQASLSIAAGENLTKHKQPTIISLNISIHSVRAILNARSLSCTEISSSTIYCCQLPAANSQSFIPDTNPPLHNLQHDDRKPSKEAQA